MEIRDVNMDFAYGGSFTESSPEAYERLILDVLLGDPPLFPQHEEVELSWEILDPDPGLLGELPSSLSRTNRVLGTEERRRDAGPRRHRLEAAVMIITLEGTTRPRFSASCCGRRSAGSPAQGMVLTLIIVCDESEYSTHWRPAWRPAASIHPGSCWWSRRGAQSLAGRRGHIGEGTPGEVVVIRMRGALQRIPPR
jgi:hypothetical protein